VASQQPISEPGCLALPALGVTAHDPDTDQRAGTRCTVNTRGASTDLTPRQTCHNARAAAMAAAAIVQLVSARKRASCASTFRKTGIVDTLSLAPLCDSRPRSWWRRWLVGLASAFRLTSFLPHEFLGREQSCVFGKSGSGNPGITGLSGTEFSRSQAEEWRSRFRVWALSQPHRDVGPGIAPGPCIVPSGVRQVAGVASGMLPAPPKSSSRLITGVPGASTIIRVAAPVAGPACPLRDPSGAMRSMVPSAV
jgi:hypothetical protein